jgi:hypothetical protein
VDLSSRSPLLECFRQGGVPLDVRMQAARGGLSLPVHEQLQVLMILVSDRDREVAEEACATITSLPADALAAAVANPELPSDLREFYADREASMAAAVTPGAEEPEDRVGPAAGGAEPVIAAADAPASSLAADIEADPERRGTAQRLAMLSVAERIKVAMHGSREERSILVRDPNRLVSSAVLSSPKLTESEVEVIARMTNVSDEVLRIVGHNRTWTKTYGVIAALTRNPKTPIGVALTLLPRLIERDIKMLSTDRNIPEPIRLSARKIYTRGAARRQ